MLACAHGVDMIQSIRLTTHHQPTRGCQEGEGMRVPGELLRTERVIRMVLDGWIWAARWWGRSRLLAGGGTAGRADLQHSALICMRLMIFF